MNEWQRMVLMIGAVALIWVVWAGPGYYISKGVEIIYLKLIGVIGATLFVFFALKGIGGIKKTGEQGKNEKNRTRKKDFTLP